MQESRWIVLARDALTDRSGFRFAGALRGCSPPANAAAFVECRNLDFRSALCLTRMQSLTSLTCIMDSCDDFSLDVLPRLTRLSELTLFCVEPSVFDSMAFANLFLLRTLYLCESRLLVGEALASVTPSLTFLDYSHQFVSGFSFSHLTALTTSSCVALRYADRFCVRGSCLADKSEVL